MNENAAHVVSFTAEDSNLVARCVCGWVQTWVPDTYTLQPFDYGSLFYFGLRHTSAACGAHEGQSQ